MGYARYIIKESLGYDEGMKIVQEFRKKDIDTEYGITEIGHGIAISPSDNSKIEAMNRICKNYGITPVFVKKVDF